MGCSVENSSSACTSTIQRLTALQPGQWAEITYMDPHAPISERLGDLGLRTGKRLQCVRISFLGDPVAYLINGTDTIVAIRKQDASYIHVYILDDPEDHK